MELDWHLAKMCVDASAGVYKTGDTMRAFVRSYVYNIDELLELDIDNAQALCFKSSNHEYVISFRGTEPKEGVNDILADLKAWRTEGEFGGKVHSGFKGELDKLHDHVVKWLESYSVLEQKTSVIITGHSLGAGMASIMTARLKALGYDNISLYTFGSPRVGNTEWTKLLKDIPVYRFVNNNDIVCKIPPSFLFTHIGELHYVNYSGIFVSKYTRWGRFADGVKSRLRALTKFQPFDGAFDHPCKFYKERVYEQVQRIKSHSKS